MPVALVKLRIDRGLSQLTAPTSASSTPPCTTHQSILRVTLHPPFQEVWSQSRQRDRSSSTTNSNVLEFCSRIERNNEQEIYYLSGVGTVPESKPSLGQRYDQVLDLAFAHAMEIYLNCEKKGANNEISLKSFKKTLAREARVHFLGIWDTVSSIGFGRSRPGTNNLHEYICFIRRALALDETRVKFLVEYLYGGESVPNDVATSMRDGILRVKEVWFSGSHSDVGGGNMPNEELNNGSVPVLWMVNQSSAAGLAVTPSRIDWVDAALKSMKPKSAMNLGYRALEILPFARKTYKSNDRICPNPGSSNETKKIHISTCFIENYQPLARFERGMEVSLADIVGQGIGKKDRLDWIPKGLEEYIETDLFDISQIPYILHHCTAHDHPEGTKNQLERLGFLAGVREGARAILRHSLFPKLLFQLIEDNSGHAFDILRRLIDNDLDQYLITLPNFVEQGTPNATFETLSPILDLLVRKFQAAFDTNVVGQSEKGIKWFYSLAIASLYFSRYVQSKSIDQDTTLADLRKVQECLHAFPSAGISPESEGMAMIQDCLATTFEAEGTMEAVQEAVEIRTRLVDQHPNETYRRDLANATLTLATFKASTELGDSFDAFPHITTRSRRDSLSDDKEFAKLLSNPSNRLYDLGQMDEALETAEDSISIFRDVFPDPLCVDKDMATALNTLSNRLAGDGRYEEALKVAEEAVRMRREICERERSQYEGDLAISLANLSRRRLALERLESAREPAQHAVDIHRRLFGDNPDKYRDDLASSLVALSNVEDTLGHLEKSFEIDQEVVQLREILAKVKPASFNAHLALSLDNLATSYRNLGQQEFALAASQRAVSLREPLAKERPHIHNADLANSLYGLSISYANLGRHEDALAANQRAFSLREPLANERSHIHNADLADSLHSLGISYDNLGRYEDALVTTQRAFSIREPLAKEWPHVHNADLARSLHSLGISYANLGQHEDALKTDLKAVTLREPLARDQPRIHKKDLAASLFNLSFRYYKLGRHNEALEPARRSLNIIRELSQDRPIVFKNDLINGLILVKHCLSFLDRQAEADVFDVEIRLLEAEGGMDGETGDPHVDAEKENERDVHGDAKTDWDSVEGNEESGDCEGGQGELGQDEGEGEEGEREREVDEDGDKCRNGDGDTGRDRDGDGNGGSDKGRDGSVNVDEDEEVVDEMREVVSSNHSSDKGYGPVDNCGTRGTLCKNTKSRPVKSGQCE
ncbi:hypothetical protein NLI96_g11682 [Meripilus lineatus]|uniref:T6SS Phospholipase effector Tle1-like catalytic domain-containing protein n=1 Tax=Meripilus lineatus TaxID=2056292 RepID=A0AAD5YD39_9APHY|nr:hypothetical protein NLI96_g11682 [Physisporinus lineatus]